METSEKELIEKANSGDRIAQSRIVQKYERMVYNLGLKLLGNSDEAECILQETFLKVLESLRDFRGKSQLSTWIYRIATNQALMRLRSRKKEYATFTSENDEGVKDYSNLVRSFEATPLDDLLNSELRQKMTAAVEMLPPKYKSVFVLKDIEGLSLKEISDILDISLPAVKSNLHRARLFLREKLAGFINGKT
ncbi:sigma-70 family RNA polymerase sigma factor [candidate division KSB1 bacterium]|nr:sigma-70 family RNA polymerase sigma factor [candidate division KSB1 bacterium]